MDNQPTMIDDELRDLLFESGLTPYEIEARLAVLPKEKLIINTIMKITIHRLTKRLMGMSIET